MAKTMIFLIDGTGNDATEETFSNIYAINQLIAETKRARVGKSFRDTTQVTFYLPGIGTKFTVKRPAKGLSVWFGRYDTVRQQLFGDHLEQIILRAYVNLCANYRRGDKIVLLGFSRGAVAARILSRLVSDFGILVSDRLLYLDRMWNEFVEISKNVDDAEYLKEIDTLQNELRQQAGEEILHVPTAAPISFLGLFDTVAGELDNTFSKHVHLRDQYPAKRVEHIVHIMSMHDVRKEFELIRLTRGSTGPDTLREIWMPGVHSDVGGGYDEDFISSVSLLTMSDMLEELADVAIDTKARDKVIENIREKVRDKRLVINKEPKIPRRYSRKELIKADDEIHPLHWYLLDQPVYWKETAKLTIYNDLLNRPKNDSDESLRRKFSSWVRLE